jgi:hypothetical protein
VFIAFDKQNQIYKLETIKCFGKSGRNELYAKRFSKYSEPACYEFFPKLNGDLVLKTGSGVKVLNNSLGSGLIDLRNPIFVP